MAGDQVMRREEQDPPGGQTEMSKKKLHEYIQS